VGDMPLINNRFLTQSRYRALGGSTNCWGGWCAPLDQADFAGHGAFPAWPLGRGELDPFYARAQGICSLGPFQYDPRYWIDRSDGRLAEMPGDGGSVRTASIQYPPGPWLRFATLYRAELQSARNLWVVLNSNVVSIDAEQENGMDYIKTVSVQTLPQNKKFTVTARRFVVALGGIETVRALLNSPSATQREGLGNNHDQLGRYFNVHPLVTRAATASFGDPAWAKPVQDLFGNPEFPVDPSSPQPPVTGQEVPDYEAHADGDQPEPGPEEARSVYVMGTLVPTADALAASPHGSFRVMLGGTPQSCNLNVCWEQVPARENRVTLSDSVDVFGKRRVLLEWKLSAADLATYDHALQETKERLTAAGYALTAFTRTFDIHDRATWSGSLQAGEHHMGGTRMAQSPREGVVNADCRLHAVSNLYVSGPSNWPSSGWANPTLTIVAMAIRLADHLRALVAAEPAEAGEDTGPSPWLVASDGTA
jgi:choline dehydrogenase-like flavoprotein